jgi:hypothetical protein
MEKVVMNLLHGILFSIKRILSQATRRHGGNIGAYF